MTENAAIGGAEIFWLGHTRGHAPETGRIGMARYQIRAGQMHSLRNVGEDDMIVLAIYDPPRKRADPLET
jgi:hypothetical protein